MEYKFLVLISSNLYQMCVYWRIFSFLCYWTEIGLYQECINLRVLTIVNGGSAYHEEPNQTMRVKKCEEYFS